MIFNPSPLRGLGPVAGFPRFGFVPEEAEPGSLISQVPLLGIAAATTGGATRAEVDDPFEALERAGAIIIAGREVLDAERHEHGWRIVPKEATTDGLRERIAPAETDDEGAGGGAR